MKQLITVLLLGLSLAMASLGQSSAPRAELLNPKTVEAISADEFRQLIAHHRGKVVLVNFWATWCAPCIKEIPEIIRLQEKYKERGLRVIAVSMDEPEELEANVRPFVAKRFPSFVSYLCKESDHDKFASVIDPTWAEILPTNFLIDRDGKLKVTLTGGKSYEEFEAAITPLLP
ncbi:MAG: redoxin domain-containing protein [Blastocatellia bacterium]|nr:redoxin domain-containing protein [Blastocatellia bacterium]